MINQVNSFIEEDAVPRKTTNLRVNLGKLSMYPLPKIHKPNKPGPPIVCSCPTNHISECLDSIFQTIFTMLRSLKIPTTPGIYSILPESSWANPVTFSIWMCVLFTQPSLILIVCLLSNFFLSTGGYALSWIHRRLCASRNSYPPWTLLSIT